MQRKTRCKKSRPMARQLCKTTGNARACVCIVLHIHVHGQRVTYTTGAGNACLRPQTKAYRNACRELREI